MRKLPAHLGNVTGGGGGRSSSSGPFPRTPAEHKRALLSLRKPLDWIRRAPFSGGKTSCWQSHYEEVRSDAILITDDQRTIVTGSHEGQVCLWDLLPDLQMSSRQMLLGHTASVTCLAKARDFEKQPYVVSATENGEMSIWDITSGRCIENTRLPFRHTAICYYHSSFRMAGEGWLVCCGQYNDILIIDAITLVVLHTLTSSSSSDWISCMCLVHSLRIQEDSLLAVSAAGDLKVWDLSSSVSRIQEKQNIFERECQPLDCTLCSAIRFCTYTERLLLAVFSTCWKVYDYCDFSLLWTELSPCSQTLAGGEILAAHRLIIWTEDGHGYIYQLVNSGLSQSIQPSKGGVLKETVRPVLLSSTEVEDNKSFSYIMGFMNERKEPFYKILYSGQASGRITLWHVPDVPVSTLDGSPKVIPIAASRTMQDNFNIHCQIAEGIPDHPWEAPITVSTYIPSLEKLVCGCKDGRIITVPALHAAKARLLGEDSVQKDATAVPHVLSGTGCSGVTALLVLPSRPAPCWLLSGSQDSCVVWWDLFTGEALHRFVLDAGPIVRLLLSPDSCRRKGHRLVCCVCSDHSIVLLHVQERTCLLRARKHLFPVTALRWHPMENLLVVGCENDSVYVWDIETGSLERYESGETAKAILSSCEDSGLMADPLYAALEEDGHREKDLGGPLSSSLAFGSFSCSRLAHQRRSFSHQLTTLCWAQGPFAVWPLRATWESINVNILLFDLEKLVELLCSSQANGLKMSLVQRIINSPSEKSSLMKCNKWRPAASLVLDDFNLETSPHMLRFPVCESDNRSFVKLISCWRDQSIEVMEATQATLLAEVEQSIQQKTLAGGHGQTNSTRQGTEGAENLPLQGTAFGTMGMIKCESCITTPNVEDREGSAEEPGNPGEVLISGAIMPADAKKPLPWVSKLCSCKLVKYTLTAIARTLEHQD
ncbi:WD repeat-containing protein 72 [Crotalus adamanteus]|uniref:WD repeat-containing protein 72 n=1 Tax=Crotalus adamanteus TaxID=8729 RepID=A0AAW1AW00_CROAD